MKPSKKRRPTLKWILLSLLSGLFSGLAATVFLFLLDIATKTREAHLSLIWFLPLAGLTIGWLYHRFGKEVARGNNLILEQIHDPKNTIPFVMAPLVLLGTVVTHLFGGSAGREGTAVQMGASLSDQLSHFFKIEKEERKILLVAGAGAGFGAAIGTPWAGVVFGMEVIQIGKLRPFAVVECFLASFTAYYTAVVLHAPHSVYPNIEIGPFQLQSFLWVSIAGILFGITAMLFSKTTHTIEKMQSKYISLSYLRPFVAGILLVLLYYWEGTYRYAGLGISTIQDSLNHVSPYSFPLYKFIFTALTVGSGFKGGEFIPLVFIGSTLGSALSTLLPVSASLLAAVGFAAVFGAAANTPLACSIMAVEIFGFQIAPYALVACYVSFYFSGHKGIYKTQRIAEAKHTKILKWFRGPR